VPDTNTIVRSRIDPAVKNEASKILRSMGLTLSDGIRLFLHQIIVQKELPFSVKTPNSVTGIQLAGNSPNFPIQGRSQKNCKVWKI
jgi:DNA-damage-inducible protein J